MDLDRLRSLYKEDYVSYSLKNDSNDPPPPRVIYEQCTPHPIFYLTDPPSKCNWKSCPYITPMPQKYPYIIEALKTDPPRDLLQIDRDYYKIVNQIGYCRMKRSCKVKVPKNMIDCYELVCKPFMCPEKAGEELKVEKNDVKSSKEDSAIHHHIQPKPNPLTGSNKDQLEAKVMRKYTEVASQVRSPTYDELDLDYLERRQNATIISHTSQSAHQKGSIESSPESVDRIKVIVLGASAVGKTSIIQQFVWNDFCPEYVPTDRKHTYYPSVITHDRLYEIKITDLPVIPYFPVNTFYEWTDFRYYGLRSSTAYILVFDLSNLETFQFVRTLKEQIYESRNMANVPVLVVGNKEDLIVQEDGSGGGVGSGKLAITSGPDEKRRDIVNLVKKHWKCGYIECSAKYNWKVIAVFKELMNMIDSVEIRDQSPMLDNIQEALDRNKCAIL